MRRFSGDEYFSSNDLYVVDQIVRNDNGMVGHGFEHNPRQIEAR
jgi:hypothetical protein